MTDVKPDYYGAWVSSDAYRSERADKAEVVLRLCREALEDATHIGDVGCGTGLVKRALEDALQKPIVGFEIDVSFVEVSDRVVAADACRLPVPDASFDVLILNHLYEHVQDQAGLFREAWRVLRPGGLAYVAAGSRRAVLEPHYRLPFLSWLPRRLADRYVRWTGRGNGYGDIRFLTYTELERLMSVPGFRVRDITERALKELLGEDRGSGWRPAWALMSRSPRSLRRRLLQAASPQWFFTLTRPTTAEAGQEAVRGRGAA